MKAREHVLEYSSPKVDGRIIVGVKVIGCESSNGYTYPVPVLKKAMNLYESAPVFVLHPQPLEKKRGSRQLTDFFGTLQNVRQRQNGKGIYADLHIRENHPLASSVLEEAAGAARLGLSHNAIVEMDDDAKEVTAIVSVNSVDLVDNPATTKNLFESEDMTTPEKENTEPDKIQVLEEKLDRILERLDKQPPEETKKAAPPKRLAVLEEIPPDEQAIEIGHSHTAFLDTLRGFQTA